MINNVVTQLSSEGAAYDFVMSIIISLGPTENSFINFILQQKMNKEVDL